MTNGAEIYETKIRDVTLDIVDVDFDNLISTHTSLAGRDRYILYKIPAVHPTSRDGQIQCI